MADHIVDTNVLLVASAAHPYSPFADSDLPLEQQQVVLDWLAAFREDASGRMVWDTCWKIHQEYRNKLTDQDFGLLVVTEKMASARFVEVSYDSTGAAIVPAEFGDFDRSDRKLLASLLADGGQSSLVNATDTDWLEIEDRLLARGLRLELLLERWLRAKYAEKH